MTRFIVAMLLLGSAAGAYYLNTVGASPRDPATLVAETLMGGALGLTTTIALLLVAAGFRFIFRD